MSEAVSAPATTAPESATPARPQPSGSGAPAAHGATPVKRQVVCFSFYKVMPEWRRLPAEEKAAHKQAFAEVLTQVEQAGRVPVADLLHDWYARRCRHVRLVDRLRGG